MKVISLSPSAARNVKIISPGSVSMQKIIGNAQQNKPVMPSTQQTLPQRPLVVNKTVQGAGVEMQVGMVPRIPSNTTSSTVKPMTLKTLSASRQIINVDKFGNIVSVSGSTSASTTQSLSTSTVTTQSLKQTPVTLTTQTTNQIKVPTKTYGKKALMVKAAAGIDSKCFTCPLLPTVNTIIPSNQLTLQDQKPKNAITIGQNKPFKILSGARPDGTTPIPRYITTEQINNIKPPSLKIVPNIANKPAVRMRNITLPQKGAPGGTPGGRPICIILFIIMFSFQTFHSATN